MSAHVKLCLIAARASNNVIGSGGDLPWRLKSDLAFFKKATLGCPIIMGRKTWESLPVRPLKGRENIVMTRDWAYNAEGARVYSSFAAATNSARAVAARTAADKVFVIGGEAIYKLALPIADRLYLTEVDAAPDGDAYFPELDANQWKETGAEQFEAGEGNDFAFSIRQLDRISAFTSP
ncbi:MULTISPECIES: dihydrofolate reductase [unclassified Hyphomonas]|jgi:dihydrofolate reductase|uniref:dihydrofolate reductase n=1 Tax=hydrothermal vent metagenome TaxID=652676 RepID=A0A160U1D0_9ZZZZ|nr:MULTISPECIES: dihydrofolate reductase [unclassified Hyphomonas]MAN91041.1 dihydrofolate reductase [Hyphomonadaceae bacterium]MAL45078.1 dihydrofolate reductase [Hyphomonas sp.]MAX83702.1 dihydrofolate reductase [Hyphomonas sp.]MBO6581581.1 dihydrofolate reductase [Hyphomonas sp.]MDF1805725.1 dihydrofolate reductase [Hyphomonas sp.]|tara:strand:+ start:8073 stop:8609 length:537 start_codon:yes stop_codon:yes gene_type:complete